jgi:hypothetical protein
LAEAPLFSEADPARTGPRSRLGPCANT